MIFPVRSAFAAVVLFIFIFIPQNEVQSSIDSEVVDQWAEKFGNELWDLAQKMTKSNEIKARYKTLNAKVQEKNGTILIADIVASIGRMLNRKMDAVKCIVNRSEEYAEEFHRNNPKLDMEFQYYSSKYSLVNGLNLTNRKFTDFEEFSVENKTYLNMTFDLDSHFFDLPVNTEHSSVHIPTNVYHKVVEVAEFIQWSEELDVVFRQNYNSDPALSWQYFGTNLGAMRHYPAMSWPRNKTDTYDCRKRSWYIETATCSKDVVILLDNSGSMTGYRFYIAQLTIKSLLDTFSNNDFVNILQYSNETKEVIPCFEDILVQATPENIETFNEGVASLQPYEYANVTLALEKAFKLLAKYREIRKCNESSTGCNQAIMLVTDGVPGNATDVFEKYNWFGNDSKSYPVRIFTYLLGKEVTKVKEIQLYACMNRGYYSHIQSVDEVAEEVLKYVNVIAAPLVLQKKEHPPTWTHAYIDMTSQTDNDEEDDEEDGIKPVQNTRMMIAVGVPAYNYSSYPEGNYTGRPQLLGVAGTDVPLEDINQQALPYKLGVNGYAFIVSNNGYVLLHPDLRPYDPDHPGELKDNYNSVDLSEIEQFEDDVEPREPSERLLELRRAMVNHEFGKFIGVPVKFHYDKMRRVDHTKQDFYFAPIPHTPFSLGIALPHDYGNTWIKVGDEIQRNTYTKINISDFFVGENWKIHPDWVYCRYHYLEGHEFKTPEEELREFLRKIVDKDWKWSQQYEPDAEADKEKETDELNCGRKSLTDDSYYCNKELVQLLVFDAKVTNDSYQSWTFKSEAEREIIERYNATVRFVSTMSGLTRWQFVFGEEEVAFDTEFGDLYSKALNEPWYKSAVLQHKHDKQSFLYSVPHYNDTNEINKSDPDLKVTAAMAIFPRDGGKEAPSAVVGFQFSHRMMYERFMEITSAVNCDDCLKSCGDDEQFCYVIDNNGYILISESDTNDTGRFFGEVEGAVMNVMVKEHIFDRITVYDYQGLCKSVTRGNETEEYLSSARGQITPFKFLLLGLKYIFTEMLVELSRFKLWVTSEPVPDYEDIDYSDSKIIKPKKPEVVQVAKAPHRGKGAEAFEAEEYFRRKKEEDAKKLYDHFYPCDKQADLYIVNETFIRGEHSFSSLDDAPSEDVRPFYVSRIRFSNLLLVVVDKMKGDSPPFELTTKPVELDPNTTYNSLFPCYKIYMNSLPRRRLDECFTEHPEEEEMAYCGSASRIKFTVLLLLMLFPIVCLLRF